MTSGAPCQMYWDGEALKPVDPYWLRRALKEFTTGEIYRIVDQPERSTKSHNHLFAAIEDTWKNLPPLMAERFSSPKSLRKYCLIKAGHCFSDSIACPSHSDALRVAAFVRGNDEFAVVTVQKNVVTRYTAKSIAQNAMEKADFQKVKDAVLQILSELIGVAKHELSKNAGAAA